MKAPAGLILAVVVLISAGCASTPQQPIRFDQSALGQNAGRIGIAMTALPKVDTHLHGADCLLCIAAASLANSSLSAHATSLPYEDLPGLKGHIAELLRKKGADVIVIPDDIKIDALADFDAKGPNIAPKDYSPLQQRYRIDKLLVINITSLGFLRTYSGYIPTSDPKGMVRGVGYIVNLNGNTYEWYMPVDIARSATHAWDEPPKFPGLTNAYFQALEIGKDSFLRPFIN